MSERPLPVSQAPGCFTSALAYKNTARECIVCPFQERCAARSAVNLLRMRRKFGISLDLEGPHDLENPHVTRGARMVWQDMNRTGVDVAHAIDNGSNPFHAPQYMKAIVHILLKRPEGTSVLEIDKALANKLNWSMDTALMFRMVGVLLLQHYGVAVLEDGFLRLAR